MYALLTIAALAAATNDGNANTRPEWKVKFYESGSACSDLAYLGCAASSAAGVTGCSGRVGNCTPALAVLGGVASPDPDEVPTRTLTVESRRRCRSTTRAARRKVTGPWSTPVTGRRSWTGGPYLSSARRGPRAYRT